MTNVKEVLLVISILVVFGTLCFFTGYFYSRRGITYLERELENSRELIERQKDRVRAIEGKIQLATRENRELTEGLGKAREKIERLTGEVTEYRDRLEGVGEGLSEDIEGISGVIERIDHYIQSVESTEEN